MSCKFPLVRDKITGQILYSTTNEDFYLRRKRGNHNEHFTPNEIIEGRDYVDPARFQLIPCGRCMECRLAYSREWANRCVIESLAHKSNWFITLTYDPEHVPVLDTRTGELTKGGIGIIRDGEIVKSLTLYPPDVKTFINSLRKRLERSGEPPIRYYMCGEYGSTTARPHYHMIIFDLAVPDLQFYKLNQLKQPYFTSDWLQSLWGKGFITLGEVNWDTCAYTARYILKKIKGREAKDTYHELGIIPEYTTCSRMPGIGNEYYQLNKDQIYKLDEIILPGKKAKKIQPPKYYDKLYDVDNPERLAEIKKAREDKARLEQKVKLAKTTDDLWTMLRKEHEAKQEAYNKLIRPLK